MWTPLLSALLAAAPTPTQPWGLSLELKGDAIFVARVEAGSPADLAGVKAGAQLSRIVQPPPRRRLAVGTLTAESFDDVEATLRESSGPQLVLEFAGSGARDQKVLDRAPFKQKTQEELRALTPKQMNEYFFALQRDRIQHHAALRAQVRFEFDNGDPVAIVDPKKHLLTGLLSGGATGEWLWVQGKLAYTCPTSPALSVTIRGPGPAAPVVVDLTSSHLYGATRRVLLPAARLAEVEKCPAGPLVRALELELKCEKDEPVLGREKLRLALDCSGAKRADYVAAPFTRLEPAVFETRVPQGTATVTVRPHLDRDGPLPTAVAILVNDKAGKAVVTVPDAWRPDPGNVDQLPDAKVPVPAAVGKYTVVYEASWADGSTSRSSGTALDVLSVAEDAKARAEFSAGSKAMIGLQDKMEAAGVNPCDRKTAIPWLRKQPEVESLTITNESDYSYFVKKFPAPMIVHCD